MRRCRVTVRQLVVPVLTRPSDSRIDTINLINDCLYGRADPYVRHLADRCRERYIVRCMPYTYEIDVERQLVVAVLSADATIAEAEGAMAHVYADPRHSFGSVGFTTAAPSRAYRR